MSDSNKRSWTGGQITRPVNSCWRRKRFIELHWEIYLSSWKIGGKGARTTSSRPVQINRWVIRLDPILGPSHVTESTSRVDGCFIL